MTRPGRPDPLQPDERALADALATTAPAQGPDPALDAAILAAARADAAARSGAGTGPAPEAATVARATTGGTGSVDAPDVREAWLGRIRELIAAERFDEARASFAEFQRRHPDAAVPDDLRQLLGGE